MQKVFAKNFSGQTKHGRRVCVLWVSTSAKKSNRSQVKMICQVADRNTRPQLWTHQRLQTLAKLSASGSTWIPAIVIGSCLHASQKLHDLRRLINHLRFSPGSRFPRLVLWHRCHSTRGLHEYVMQKLFFTKRLWSDCSFCRQRIWTSLSSVYNYAVRRLWAYSDVVAAIWPRLMEWCWPTWNKPSRIPIVYLLMYVDVWIKLLPIIFRASIYQQRGSFVLEMTTMYQDIV